MVIQFGKVGINCSVYFSKEDFVSQFTTSIAQQKLDINDCYKKYRKQYDKLNPKVVKSTKKKKNKEA
jgi:hypothetical protein